jgi:NhaP-type Na+/H+ and K+/H+ antiporter
MMSPGPGHGIPAPMAVSMAGPLAAQVMIMRTWRSLSMVSRNGQLVQVRGNTALRTGDEVVALGDPGVNLDRIFRHARTQR